MKINRIWSWHCACNSIWFRCSLFVIFICSLWVVYYSPINDGISFNKFHSVGINSITRQTLWKGILISKSDIPHFSDLNCKHAVTFHNICIQHYESKEYNTIVLKVIHYINKTVTKAKTRLAVLPDVKMETKDIKLVPSGVEFLNAPLFVVNTKAIENIHHNMEDLGVPLYYMMNRTGSLGSDCHLVYTGHPVSSRTAFHGLNASTTYIRSFELLKPLSRNQPIKAADHFKQQMCFKHAVFFRSDVSTNTRTMEKLSKWNSQYRHEMADYIMSKIGIKNDRITCPKVNLVTIIKRRNDRLILNIKKMVHIIQSAGIANVTLAEMETLTLKQQIQLVHCSDVYVGIHGAALQWAMFLQKGRTLIEIAWPRQNWSFRFTDNRFRYDKNIKKIKIEVLKENLVVDNVELVKHMYTLAEHSKEMNYYTDDKYIANVIKEKVKHIDSHSNNPYHFASVLLNEKVFLKALCKALHQANTSNCDSTAHK